MTTFIEISLILAVAALISAVMRMLKQPLIIGYIITGLIVGPYALDLVQNPDSLELFSQFGISLLLFIVGLNLSPRVIKEVGKVATITGVGQVVFTSTIGFILCILLGFTYIEGAYIAVALTFSSTIIVLKLLSDKGDLEKLYGKISVGFLLIQDIIATLILILISAFSLGSNISEVVFQLLWKGATITVILFLIIKFVFPLITKFFAKSQEFLFLFSIAWGMGLASIFSIIGFSMEIGALIAGICLALFPYNFEIAAKMRPLRDFFIILFFILLGIHLTFESVGQVIVPAIVLSTFVLIGNPLIMMFLMKLLGYNKKVGFYSGLTVAQISEFSIILVGVGYKVGHIDSTITSLVTVVGLVTIAASSYLITFADRLYPILIPYLKFFSAEKQTNKKVAFENYDIVLFGYNRIGYDFLQVFLKLKKSYLVVDYDPEVINRLINAGIPNKYGDAGDPEFIDDINFVELKMMVSTIPDYELNASLIRKVREVNKDCVLIVVSHHINDTYMLYSLGASYVVMPHFLGAKYASALVYKNQFDLEKFTEDKEKHINNLRKRISLGHEHPEIVK